MPQPRDDNGRVEVTASLHTAAEPESLFAQLDTLDGYPQWLEIVSRAEPSQAAEGDPGPAWMVDLRAQLGPLRRSKRLRMVRVQHDPPHVVRFTRRELDGRSHSEWTLIASVDPDGDGSTLEMFLHYGGGLWIPLLDRLLRDEIERSKPRLVRIMEDADRRGG